MKRLIIFSTFISVISLSAQESMPQEEWNHLAKEYVEILQQTPEEEWATVKKPFIEKCKFLDEQIENMIPENEFSSYRVSSKEAEYRTSTLLNVIHSCYFPFIMATNKHNLSKKIQTKSIRGTFPALNALQDYAEQIDHNQDYKEIDHNQDYKELIDITSTWNKEHTDCIALHERIRFMITESPYLHSLKVAEYRRNVILDGINSCMLPLSMTVNGSDIANRDKARLMRSFWPMLIALDDYDRLVDYQRANKGVRQLLKNKHKE